ncbi:MAG: DNA polymerase III subunit delta', partial [Pseudolysinimonas sp.]
MRAAATDDAGLTHSWLITGPPGSGRSILAYAFAAALIARPGEEAATEAQVQARTHPDLGILSTDRVTITIDEVRQLVAASQYSPSVGRYRVMVIEDADRMTERTSNVLLKALEEPPPRTVWILCAPSEADLIPTIRSRVRSVRLRVPRVDEVAELISRRDGISLPEATTAAREAQSHIGRAHRLATNEEARDRRRRTLELALGIRSVSGAVLAAAELLALATDDAKAFTDEHDAEERDRALRSLGIEPGGAVPPALRAQLKALEEDQKRRATRSLRD